MEVCAGLQIQFLSVFRCPYFPPVSGGGVFIADVTCALEAAGNHSREKGDAERCPDDDYAQNDHFHNSNKG